MRDKLIRSNTMQKQGVGTPACLRGQTSLITPCLTYFDPRGKTMHGILSNHLQEYHGTTMVLCFHSRGIIMVKNQV